MDMIFRLYGNKERKPTRQDAAVIMIPAIIAHTSILFALNKSEQAELFSHMADDALVRLFGPQNMFVSAVHTQMAFLKASAGKLEEAKGTMKETQTTARKAYGEGNHLAVVESLHSRAML